MKASKDRLGRKDHPRRAHALAERLRQGLRWLGILPVTLIAIALLASPAQALTGGMRPGLPSPSTSSTASISGDLVFSPMRVSSATWYGPGLYGNETACGQVLRPGTIGVAHRDLPCGTTVKFAYQGHYLVTRVIDRGPYTDDYDWDLTNGARKALGFTTSDEVRYAIGRSLARH